MLTASSDSLIKKWRISSGDELMTIETDGGILSMVVSGGIIYVGDRLNCYSEWDFNSGVNLWIQEGLMSDYTNVI
jgi:WD40 repeat protein